MRIKMEIEIEFDSWFNESNEPTTEEEWEKFLCEHLMPDSSVIGIDDEDNPEMIALRKFNLQITYIQK